MFLTKKRSSSLQISEKKAERMKRIWKIIAIGVCAGLLLGVLKGALHIDEDVFMRWYWAGAGVVILGAVLVNVIYNICYQKRMKKLVPLLEAQKPREYITGVEQLLQTAKGQNLRTILTMNLSAGYIDLKEFDKAIELLEGISDKRLAGSAVKTVYRLNLCICYLQSGQGEKGLELYGSSQAIFKSQRDGKLYGGNIAILDILAAIQKKEYSQAEELLDEARQRWIAPRFQEAFQEIEHTLTEIKKEQNL